METLWDVTVTLSADTVGGERKGWRHFLVALAASAEAAEAVVREEHAYLFRHPRVGSTAVVSVTGRTPSRSATITTMRTP